MMYMENYYIIYTGDWNIGLYQEKDEVGYVDVNNPNAKECVFNQRKADNLVYVWWKLDPHFSKTTKTKVTIQVYIAKKARPRPRDLTVDIEY